MGFLNWFLNNKDIQCESSVISLNVLLAINGERRNRDASGCGKISAFFAGFEIFITFGGCLFSEVKIRPLRQKREFLMKLCQEKEGYLD